MAIICRGDTKKSRVVTDRIINLYCEKGVSIVDVAELIKDIPEKDRMASPVDAHPNELVNNLVANALYELFVQNGLVH